MFPLAQLAVFAKANLRRVGVKIVNAGFFDFKEKRRARVQSRPDQILDDFLLAVNSDGASAGQFVHVDAMTRAVEIQLDAVMNQA